MIWPPTTTGRTRQPNVVAHIRAHRNALVVIFTIILVSTAFVILDYPLIPLSTTIDIGRPLSIPTAIHAISDSVSVVQFSDIEEGVTYHPFSKLRPSECIADHTIRPIRAHNLIPDNCLDAWIAWGQWEGPCADVAVEESRIDLVYIWVNGSDPLHEQARAKYTNSPSGERPKNARFREHDELRHSFRASGKASTTWKNSRWHLVTADVEHPEDDTKLLGLVPQWLDVNGSVTESPHHQPPIYLHHASQLFRLINSTEELISDEDAMDWREHVLPNFNSFSVESQLSNLDSDLVSDNIIALNDDQYIVLPSPPSAFHSPLYGPVLRFDSAFQVQGDASGTAAGDGEWRSLGWSAHLLNQRFGARKRSYVLHNARSLSLPLLHEASLAFGPQFSATPLSRFRGWHEIPGEYEVNTMFHATHFIIERRREALLWSWIVAKWGGKGEGHLDEDLKNGMWEELGGISEEQEVILDNLRVTREDDVDTNMRLAGLAPPRAEDPTASATTEYWFVSQNGYPTALNGLPLPTTLDREECLGFNDQSAWDLFRDILLSKPQCGDAIIAALTRKSDAGLAVFLPPGSTERDPTDPITLPLTLTVDPPPLPRNPRAFAVRLIHRYSFVVGKSPSRFFGIGSLGGAKWLLGEVDEQRETVLLCINDDLPDSSQEDEFLKTDLFLRQWQRDRWPDKLDREL
ncbi:hypothetical protein CPB85DRAFT_1439621 [Mucidula mucida]|nr:hypothetical protein CPB85DRAFT_1439621 [Mucidula mucida]